MYIKLIALKLVIPILVVIVLVLRAMWVRVTPPGGRKLTRAESPALFAMIDKLRASLEAPRFHRVLLNNDFNASVTQVPLLGMFGWQRNYLLIGLPLMKAMTPPQFESVLAHEFGHLAGGHARVSTWIYRMRMSWARLIGLLQQHQSWGSFLFIPFFKWYIPYFNAYSFPLARANEYEADSASGRLVSPESAAEALTASAVVGRYLSEKYWPGIFKRAEASAEPNVAPYSGFGGEVASGLDAAIQQAFIDQAVTEITTTADTHPCLADRLRALNQVPRLALPAPGASADSLLGPLRDAVASEFDIHWRQAIAPAWAKRYKEVQAARQRLTELEDIFAKDGDLPPDQLLERAILVEAFGAGEQAALEQFRGLHDRHPDNKHYAFALGLRLLARDDAAGVNLVQSGVNSSSDPALQGAQALRDYYWRIGDKKMADSWHGRFVAQINLLQR